VQSRIDCRPARYLPTRPAGAVNAGLPASGTGGENPFSDSYRPGTFVAGLIAGDGASAGGRNGADWNGADWNGAAWN
jgi:hypothetical protein